MTEVGPRAEDQPSRRVVEQRVRNRIIEYLQLASSFEEQRKYERNAPAFVDIPGEVIEQWADWGAVDPQRGPISDVFTAEEVAAMKEYDRVWDDVADRLDWPVGGIAAAQQLPEWDELRRAATAALVPFERRGRMPEDEEA